MPSGRVLFCDLHVLRNAASIFNPDLGYIFVWKISHVKTFSLLTHPVYDLQRQLPGS